MNGKKKIVALVLLILFGGVGAHNFYAGKTAWAFVNLSLTLVFTVTSFLGMVMTTIAPFFGYIALFANAIIILVQFIQIIVKDKYGECERW